MKRVKILGSGCGTCNQLFDAVKAVVAAEGIAATVEKVEDLQQIMAYQVLSTPALVIDEKVVSKGRLLSHEEIKALLSAKAEGCCGSHGTKTAGGSSCCC